MEWERVDWRNKSKEETMEGERKRGDREIRGKKNDRRETMVVSEIYGYKNE